MWEAITISFSIAFGGFITILIHSYHQKRDKDSRISNMKKAIKQEMQEHIDDVKKEDLTTIEEDHLLKTDLRFLAVALFESSVNSGNFILLPDDLREKISKHYIHVHLANNQIHQLIQSQFTVTDDTEKLVRIIKLQLETLEKTHEEILEGTEKLIEKL